MWLEWRLLKAKLPAILLLASLTGCAWQDGLSAEETFNRALAGLSGVDNFAFKGEAAIRTEENGLFQETLAFEGRLKNHADLTLSSRTPARLAPAESGMRAGRRLDDGTADQAGGLTVALKRKEGKWNTLSSGHAEEMWMARLNPLEQLEFIGDADKKVSAELGAARGTKMLRIELSPEASAEMAKRSLQGQMQVLRERMERKGDPLYSADSGVRKRLLAVWKRDFETLEAMLAEAETASVFHLTIDRKSQLPTRMTMERRLSFVDESGSPRTETLLSDVTFTGY